LSELVLELGDGERDRRRHKEKLSARGGEWGTINFATGWPRLVIVISRPVYKIFQSVGGKPPRIAWVTRSHLQLAFVGASWVWRDRRNGDHSRAAAPFDDIQAIVLRVSLPHLFTILSGERGILVLLFRDGCRELTSKNPNALQTCLYKPGWWGLLLSLQLTSGLVAEKQLGPQQDNEIARSPTMSGM